MYTVCIAEDEYYVQKSIEARITALHKNIEIKGCAGTGKEAEELYELYKPDIFFVDINMPQCTGLQFIEQIRRKDKESTTVFIIVSGYSDYEYMRKAISVNVFDYLKKPIVPAEFVKLLLLALEEVDKLKSLGNNSASDKGIYYDEYLKKLDGHVCEGQMFAMMILNPENKEEKNELLYAFKNQMEEYGECDHIIFKNTVDVHVLYLKAHSLPSNFVEKRFLHYSNTGALLNIAYVNMKSQKLEEALQLLNIALSRRIYGDGFCLKMNEEKLGRADIKKQFFLCKNEEDTKNILKEQIRILYDQKNPFRIGEFFHDFIYMLVKEYNAKKVIVPELLKRNMLLFSIADFKNAEELESYMFSEIDTLFVNLYDKPSVELIDQICDYIEMHYQENLNLETLAEEFYLSSSHLSHYFKKKKEVSVGKYIENIRLEHAERLLQKTDESISDIADQVGYGDGNYFTKVFRKKHNMTPSEYRKYMAI